MQNPSVELGKRIKNLRIKNKFSQEKLAELSKLHPTYIGQIERGEKSPTIDSIFKIAVGLNITLEKLFENFSSEADTQNEYAKMVYDKILYLSDEKQKDIYEILTKIIEF